VGKMGGDPGFLRQAQDRQGRDGKSMAKATRAGMAENGLKFSSEMAVWGFFGNKLNEGSENSLPPQLNMVCNLDITKLHYIFLRWA